MKAETWITDANNNRSYCRSCSDCYRSCSYCRYCSSLLEVVQVAVPPIPVLRGIHGRVLAAASEPQALDMELFHACATTHCRAGWVTTLAGEAGKALEDFHGPVLAAQLIYHESSPIKVSLMRFYDTNAEALEDMRRCAAEEAALAEP